MSRAPLISAAAIPPPPTNLVFSTPPQPPKWPVPLDADLIYRLFVQLDRLLPKEFGDHPVTLVVHGGASILLHPELAQTQFQPRRTTTRDVNYIGNAFATEWRLRGVLDAPARLQGLAREAASDFHVDPEWLNANADQFLPTTTDASGLARFPVYDAAIHLNGNSQSQTLFRGKSLSVTSAPMYWSIALKLRRFKRWDAADICLLLKNASAFPWTAKTIEDSIRRNCAGSFPEGVWFSGTYLTEQREKMQQIVDMLDGRRPLPDPEYATRRLRTASTPARYPSRAGAATMPPIPRALPEHLRPYTGVRPATAGPAVIPPYPGNGAHPGVSRSYTAQSHRSGYPSNTTGPLRPPHFYHPRERGYSSDSTASISSGGSSSAASMSESDAGSDTGSEYDVGEFNADFAGMTPPPAHWRGRPLPPSAETASMSSGSSISGDATPRARTRSMYPTMSPAMSVSSAPGSSTYHPSAHAHARPGEHHRSGREAPVPGSPAYSLASSFSSMRIANFPNAASSRGSERQPSHLSHSAYPSPTPLPRAPPSSRSRTTSFASTAGSYSAPVGAPRSLPVPHALLPAPEPPQLYAPQRASPGYYDTRRHPKSSRGRDGSRFIPPPP
ncbi:hypothetical protein K523DRAFT_373573 [Schizophyllum commune Tattone D]|nr:hypothetical protein K523DRAFT_373573 [Schizophyllum commune Tattone D]